MANLYVYVIVYIRECSLLFVFIYVEHWKSPYKTRELTQPIIGLSAHIRYLKQYVDIGKVSWKLRDRHFFLSTLLETANQNI